MKPVRETFTILPCYMAFYILAFAILAKAVLLRFSMPSLPLIDGDIGGYLDPAFKLLGGHGAFRGDPVRGIYYPLFVLLNLCIGGFNAITICQHLLGIAGLILFAVGFNNLAGSYHAIIKKGVILLGLALIGWNTDLIVLEHTIRPEGLQIFFAGSTLFMLQRLYSKKRFADYAALVAIAALFFLMQPKFVLGGAFIIFCGTLAYIKWPLLAVNRLKSAIILLAGYFVFLFLMYSLFQSSDYPTEPYVARSFFYVNGKLIQKSVGYEKHFTNDEKEALKISVDTNSHDVNWPLLGFSPDNNMFGPVAEYIKKRYGEEIYGRVMLKSLIYCFPELADKVIGQITAYYSQTNICLSIPAPNSSNYRQLLEYSRQYTIATYYTAPKWDANYVNSRDNYLASAPDYTPVERGYEWSKAEVSIYAIIMLFIVIRVLLNILRGRADILTTFFMAHFLVLLTIAVLHSIDTIRYRSALLP